MCQYYLHLLEEEKVLTIKESIEVVLVAYATCWIASTICFLPSDLMNKSGKRGYTPDMSTGLHLRRTIMPGSHKTFLIRDILVTQSHSFIWKSVPRSGRTGHNTMSFIVLTLTLYTVSKLASILFSGIILVMVICLPAMNKQVTFFY